MKKSSIKAMAEDSEMKWKVEDDIRTLVKAKEIKADKKRMARVRKMAKEKVAKMKNL